MLTCPVHDVTDLGGSSLPPGLQNFQLVGGQTRESFMAVRRFGGSEFGLDVVRRHALTVGSGGVATAAISRASLRRPRSLMPGGVVGPSLRQVQRPIDTVVPGGDAASAFILAHLRLPPTRDRVIRAQLIEP